MDAHVLRRVCEALAPVLLGARIEKIYCPAPDLHSFTVFAAGRKQHLLLKAGRSDPFICLTSHRLTAPASPDAGTMRLRKHLCGRRVIEVRCQWVERRIGLRVPAEAETWLVLDLREGVRLASAFPAAEEGTPAWPDLSVFLSASGDMDGGSPSSGAFLSLAELESLWRTYPVITPALRRTLPHLDRQDVAALLVDLESGGGDLFLYSDAGRPQILSAWPLPAPLRCCGQRSGVARAMRPGETPNTKADSSPSLGLDMRTAPSAELSAGRQDAPEAGQGGVPCKLLQEEIVEDALEAATRFGESIAFDGMVEARLKAEAKPFRVEKNRLGKLLKKLDSEERRLHALLAERVSAVALQAVLYQYPADAKLPTISVEGAEGPVELALDPLKTVRENMAAMFHRSERGARGLAILQQRRAAVMAERDAAATLEQLPDAVVKAGAGRRGAQVRGRVSSLPKTVQAFRSSAGLRLLRGRNAEGNAALLRLAQPYDIWLHTENGPSAHLVIRRDHAAHEVPEETLVEAAILVGLKSWQRENAQARIMCAYVKDVRPVKGAPAGKVRVERTWRSLVVRLDAGLEGRLAELAVSPAAKG